jgi:hypothetical protein
MNMKLFKVEFKYLPKTLYLLRIYIIFISERKLRTKLTSNQLNIKS